MKYSTSLLFDMARALSTPELDGREGRVELPLALHPVVTIPKPILDIAGFSVTDQQTTSFHTSFRRTLAASQAQTSDVVCTFAIGLWRVVVGLWYFSDFSQAGDAEGGGRIQISDPDVTGSRLLQAFDDGVPLQAVHEWLWLFTEGGWTLRLVTTATGVAQTKQAIATVSASLLT